MIEARALHGPTETASEQVRRWIETPIAFWEECARDYGPVAPLDLGSLGTVFLLSDPEIVREVFLLPQDAFECRHFNEHYRYVMGDRSLLLQDGESHRRQRRLLGPMLRREQFVPKATAIREIAICRIAQWPTDTPFNPRPSFHDITFQVMVHLLLGDLEGETAQALVDTYRDAVLRQVGSWGPWRNFTRLQPHIRTLLAEEIRSRRADPARPGAMTALAQARSSDGKPISDAECEDHVFSLMIAGVDTTAIALTWSMYWLACQDRVRTTLLEELAAAGVSPDAGFQSLPYLNAVYSETLRMYPIVPTPSGRKLLRETRIGQYVFPAGSTLLPCTYLVHRREDLYPDSRAFRPERFLERRFAAYEFFPFGGGARICVGEMLAEVEFKVIVATILGQWSIEVPEVRPLLPLRYGILLAPADEFRMTVRPHSQIPRGPTA